MRSRRMALVALVSMLVACNLGPLADAIITLSTQADDANYSLHDVRLFSNQGGSVGTYRVTYRYQQIGTQGAVAPVVALIDWDSGLRFGDDILVADQRLASNFPNQELALTLTCNSSGDVAGAKEGSGESEAEVYARVEHLDGGGGVNSLDTLTITCP
jgi:hypothetical protein